MCQGTSLPVKRIAIIVSLTHKADKNVGISREHFSYSKIRSCLPQVESLPKDSSLRIPWDAIAGEADYLVRNFL